VIALSLSEVAAAVDGAVIRTSGVADATMVSGAVHTDSREVGAGSIFFALPGSTTDGHRFAAQAASAGAALIVAEHPVDVDVPQIIVSDGVAALAALARTVVARVRARGTLSVIAITGSNGKTTTKNMIAAICSAVGPTVAPRGSYNNQVGAPLSMLQVDYDTRFLVVEMGASAIGDIARLIAIVVPDIAVVLKVGMAHSGDFGSLAATQRAKSEMVTGLPENAVAVLNADDDRVAAMAGMTAARVAWFGLAGTASVRAEEIQTTAAGTSFTLVTGDTRRNVSMRILGEHHVMNALAALSVAAELGIEPLAAVSAIEAMPRAERWRMEVLHPGGGIVVLNDAYNASPDSTAAALKTLAQITGGDRRSVAVLGEMADLGEFSDDQHDHIGRLVVRLNIGKLVVVGARAKRIHIAASLEGSWGGESVLVDTPDDAFELLRDELRDGDVVLVKSSNSAKLRFLGDRLGGVAP
jgi:UDP-N-acetylmuramoyl-tripeptide--D-alanyl-D-alanine ligase